MTSSHETKKETAHLLSIKDEDGKHRHHRVSLAVYTYVKQLEAAIRYPEATRIKAVYPGRFDRPVKP